jgi:HD-like signal output (HDOD) protein
MMVGMGTSKATAAKELCWDPDTIPPFPAVALKALNLMSGTDTSLPALCSLICSDPAFTIAVLRIANSPLVAFPKNVTSVVQASMLLGFQRLRNVVITVGLRAYAGNSFTALAQSCWRHSLACAIIAERCAKFAFWDANFAYTAGILHDIGRIALVATMPRSYAGVIDRGAARPQDILRSELELCGIDHCEAGRSLVTAWNLPEIFGTIAACHHDPEVPLSGTASLIAPSCEMADVLGFAVVRSGLLRKYDEALARFPEPVRKRFPVGNDELVSEIANEIRVLESA